jgi:hypothetical protein
MLLSLVYCAVRNATEQQGKLCQPRVSICRVVLPEYQYNVTYRLFVQRAEGICIGSFRIPLGVILHTGSRKKVPTVLWRGNAYKLEFLSCRLTPFSGASVLLLYCLPSRCCRKSAWMKAQIIFVGHQRSRISTLTLYVLVAVRLGSSYEQYQDITENA